MKKIILIFTTIISLTKMYSQNRNFIFEKLPKNTNNIEELISKDSITKIYIVDVQQISELIKKSTKKYKVIYFFSPTCHSSTEMFPKFVEHINQNSSDFDFFPVSGLRYDKVNSINNYLNSINYYDPIFIIDTEKHGNKVEPFRRLDQLSTEMCPNCLIKKMGFSDFFVLNRDNVEILNTNWELNQSETERIEILKKLPTDK